MKKLLLMLIIATMCITLFAGCGNAKKDDGTTTAVETTTLARKSESSIEQGKLRGETYVNNSLGLRVYVPTGYVREDFGDLVLTPDNTDVPTYDYYIAEEVPKDENKRKTMQITVEDTKLTNNEDWINKNSKSTETKKSKAEKSTAIGTNEFASVSVSDSTNKKDYVTFAYVDKGRIVEIMFENFTYDEAIKFISESFEFNK